jgi:hypothetical protein
MTMNPKNSKYGMQGQDINSAAKQQSSTTNGSYAQSTMAGSNSSNANGQQENQRSA